MIAAVAVMNWLVRAVLLGLLEEVLAPLSGCRRHAVGSGGVCSTTDAQ